MTHSVAPVLDEIAVEELVLLGVYAIGQGTCVAHGYLLIPSFTSCGFFPLEGIESALRDVQSGQSK